MKRFFLIFVCSIIFPALAQSASWDKTIVAVERKAETLKQTMSQRGFTMGMLGATAGAYGHEENTCSIAGRLVGQTEAVLELEHYPEPPIKSQMSENEAFDVLLYVRWLESWVGAAQHLTNLPLDDVRYIWNLDCVGQWGIPKEASVSIEQPDADFVQGGENMIVLGNVDDGFYEKFVAWLEAHPETKRVEVGSGGGHLSDAVKAGRIIRERGLQTVMNDRNCYSACVFLFMAGVEREIWAPFPMLGFHQAAIGTTALTRGHPVYDIVGDYVEEMGADREFVIDAMLQASPSEMNAPQPEMLCEHGVATWVQWDNCKGRRK